MFTADNILPETASDLQPVSTSAPGTSVRSLDRNGLPALGLPISGLRDAAASPGRTCAIEGTTSRWSLPVAAAPLSTIPKRSLADTLALAVAPGVVLPVSAGAGVGGGGRAPYSNTGAQNTGEAKNPPKPAPALLDVPASVPGDVLPVHHEGFLIDWLRFVVVAEEAQGRMLAAFRPEPGDWSEMDSGHMGYRRCYRNGGVSIYYDHAEEGRGVCFDISGKGCRRLEEPTEYVARFGWLGLLGSLTTTAGVHITRLDAAIDDRKGLVCLDKVSEAIKDGRVVSRFKSSYHIEKISLSTGGDFGKTINFGSRVSDLMVRMYNKAAEQKQEKQGHWTRVEVEAKDENAIALAKALVAAGTVGAGAVVAGVLRNYVTFRERPEKDKNRSRWPLCHWWSEFLQGVESLRLALEKQEPTLERLRGWLEKQVAPTLALLFHARQGCYGRSLLDALLEAGEDRLRPKHRALRDRERVRVALVAPVGGPTGF